VSAVAAIADSAVALRGVAEVSHETLRRLSQLVALVEKWQRAENLIAPGTVAQIWRRHVADSAHLERSFAHNDKWCGWLEENIRKLGLTVTPSVANFVLIHFPETKGKTAADADAFLLKRGLVLRQVGAYNLPNALRMTVGTEEANRLVVSALSEFMASEAARA